MEGLRQSPSKAWCMDCLITSPCRSQACTVSFHRPFDARACVMSSGEGTGKSNLSYIRAS